MEIINTRLTIGLILIVLGLIILLGNMNIINGDHTLFIIGGGLFLAYFTSGKKVFQRKVGLLIAALIILMVGFFDIVDNHIGPDLSSSLFFIFLGTAFLLIYIIHTMHIKNAIGKGRWPLYTAAGIYAFALFIYLVEVVDLDVVETVVERYWPAIFVIIGGVLLFRGIGEKKISNDEQEKL